MTEMTPAEAVFFAVAALPASDRAAYLMRACAGNDDLRCRVERMLAALPEVGDFLEPRCTAPSDGATADLPAAGGTAGFGSAPAPTANYPGKASTSVR